MKRAVSQRILLSAIAFYRWGVSPMLHAIAPGGCKFEPTCSRYAAEAIEMHGAARGTWMAAGRLLRCHPFTRGGFDPVPFAAEVRGSTDLKNGPVAAGACLDRAADPLP